MTGTVSHDAPAHRIAVAELRGEARHFEGTATPGQCTALASRFGIPAVESMSWRVESAPWRSGVRLSGHIKARVVQECVVSLDPVPGEIDEPFERGFLPLADLYSEDKPGSEHEIVAARDLGEAPESLSDPLDIWEVVAEELGVALDPYPRKDGLEEAAYSAQPPGVAPLTDEDIKPFAGLADLAEKMKGTKNGD